MHSILLESLHKDGNDNRDQKWKKVRRKTPLLEVLMGPQMTTTMRVSLKVWIWLSCI